MTESVALPVLPTGPKNRADSLLASRKKKMDEMFSGKKFKIVKEVKLEGDQRFQTPFGNKGRNGFALVEIDNPDNKFVIGVTMLRQVAETYNAVDMPTPPVRKRRTKEQKAADDAALGIPVSTVEIVDVLSDVSESVPEVVSAPVSETEIPTEEWETSSV